MNNLILILIFGLAFASAAQINRVSKYPDECNQDKFVEWSKKYNRKYQNNAEESRAYNNYLKKCEIVAGQNDKFKKGISSFKVRMDEWSDLNETEFYTMRGGLVAPELKNLKLLNAKTAAISENNPLGYDTDPPVNWTEKGVVSPVKNQGSCGSCWAFAATGALESQYKIKFNKSVLLSEQYFVDCSDYYNYGCRGGNPYNVYNWFLFRKPLVTQGAYPYTGKTQNCSYNASMEVVTPPPRGVPYPIFINNNETRLKELVRDNGPIAIMIQANLLFAAYRGGIFSDPNCGGGIYNHAVLMTGYGSENGTDYWILKNSWGTRWGEFGYMRIARNKGGMCGIAIYGSNPNIPLK